jgi:hypothetical protein
MNQFPIDIARIISDYGAIWTIVPWVNELENTIKSQFCTDFYGGRMYDEYKKTLLNKNPMAEDILTDQDLDYLGLTNNPSDWAMDLIESAPVGSYEPCQLVSNPNPRAIAIVDSNFDSIKPYKYYGSLLENPGAIELIKSRNILEKVELCTKYLLYSNPNELAFDLIKNCDQIKHYENNIDALWRLAANPAPWAIKLLSGKDIRGYYNILCRNSHPRAIEFLAQHAQYLDSNTWVIMSGNPGAIDILRTHPDKVSIYIWENPAIFEPMPRPGVLEVVTTLTW